MAPTPTSRVKSERKLHKLLKRKAREQKVSMDQYLRGVASGHYLGYSQEEVDAEPLSEPWRPEAAARAGSGSV